MGLSFEENKMAALSSKWFGLKWTFPSKLSRIMDRQRFLRELSELKTEQQSQHEHNVCSRLYNVSQMFGVVFV